MQFAKPIQDATIEEKKKLHLLQGHGNVLGRKLKSSNETEKQMRDCKRKNFSFSDAHTLALSFSQQ